MTVWQRTKLAAGWFNPMRVFDMTDRQRQNLMTIVLLGGMPVLTLLWVGMYWYDYHSLHHDGTRSGLAQEGQAIIWRLFAIDFGIIGIVVVGGITEFTIGKWISAKRAEGDE